MAVRIRMKRLGRRHRPFFRVCAMDSRSPRDGRVIEELGHYDPMVRDTDARAVLKCERIDYWLSVGAKPSENVQALIKKYGTGGTHLEQQQAALAALAVQRRPRPMVLPTAPPTSEEAEAAPDSEIAEPEAVAEAPSNPEEAPAEASE